MTDTQLSQVQQLGTLNQYWRGLRSMVLGRAYYAKFVATRQLPGSMPAYLWGSFVLSFDCESAEDLRALPSVLDTLKQHDTRASFACIGRLLEKYPEEHREIAARGHEILNHTYTHAGASLLTARNSFRHLPYFQLREELATCSDSAERVLGFRPHGFRAPHFAVSWRADMYTAAADLSLKYSSSCLETQLPHGCTPVRLGEIMEIPVCTCPDHPFLALDSFHAMRSRLFRHPNETRFAESVGFVLKEVASSGTFGSIYLDPRDAVEAKMLETLLSNVGESEVRTLTYAEVVKSYEMRELRNR